jgi:hypothetical protein
MKSFLQFITEVQAPAGSKAVQQAERMGLTSDGHGGWYKEGEFVAKTQGRGAASTLVFFNKRQREGQDPAQTDQEKRLSHSSSDPRQGQGSAQPAPQMGGGQAPAPQAATGQEAPLDPLDPAAPDDAPAQFPELQENPRTKGSLTIAFGRFNPPHAGHDKLMSTVAASSDDNEYIIVPTKTEGKDTDPLDFTTKVEIMKDMFPEHSDKIVDDGDTRTIFDVLKKAHADGYSSVKLVGGGDRAKLYDRLSNEYNGKLFDFDSVETINAGDRDENSDNAIESLSASVQREHVKNGDFASFYGNLHRPVEVINPETGKVEEDLQPIVDEKKAEDIFLKLRKAMKIEEGKSLWQIAPRLDMKNLRENYVKQNIFKIGQLVENLHTGLLGRIIRRGANHLICVSEDKIMFKSWIQDVVETKMPNVSRKDKNVITKRGKNIFKKDLKGTVLGMNEAVVNGTTESGVRADQRLVGTDSHRQYAERLNPKSSWGKQFINKYRKK